MSCLQQNIKTTYTYFYRAFDCVRS